MSPIDPIFHRMSLRLLLDAANALDEAISYMRDLPQSADTVVALDLATEALNMAQGAEMALAGIQLDSNDDRE